MTDSKLTDPSVVTIPDPLSKIAADQSLIRKNADALAAAIAAAVPLDEEPEYLDYELWETVDLRVGAVLNAERVPGSKGGKLLKLSVDLGESTPRTVVSGIGLTFAPEVLVGRKFTFLTNLKPRPMMGIESQAMILATGKPECLFLAEFTGEVVPGSKLG